MTTSNSMDVLMPQMGVSVSEGVVTRWLVGVGDSVVNEQILCEISTDKTDAEISAPNDGVVIEIIVNEGETVDVGAPVARMSVGEGMTSPNDSDVASSAREIQTELNREMDQSRSEELSLRRRGPSASREFDSTAGPTFERSGRSVNEMMSGATIDPSGAADVVLQRASHSGRPIASPLALRRAKERNIDLRAIKGTGRNHRICIQDVLAAGRGILSGTARDSVTTPTVVAENEIIPIGYEDVPFTVVSTSQHRRAISEHMIRSRHTAAHMTTEVDVDMLQVSRVRDLMNASRGTSGQSRISYLSFISRAAVYTLAEFPDMNATFQHERIMQWNEVNLGIAVDTPSGLIVPVIRNAQDMTTEKIAASIVGLAEKARSRKLVPDDLRAGTFTISNPGSVGAVSAPAIINQPQTAILGIPVIVRRPWVTTSSQGGEAIAIRPIMRLAVTFDHRAIDGAYATRYLDQLRQYLETWDLREYS